MLELLGSRAVQFGERAENSGVVILGALRVLCVSIPVLATLTPTVHSGEPASTIPVPAGEDLGQPSGDRDVLRQIAREMRAAESLLREKKPASETRRVQQNIVTELDKLIDHAKQSRAAGAASAKSQQSAAQQQQEAVSPEPKPGTSPRPGEGQIREESAEDANRLQQMLSEIWGQLPDQLQKQIQSPVREQFLPAYEQLIIEYYKRLAEENRK